MNENLWEESSHEQETRERGQIPAPAWAAPPSASCQVFEFVLVAGLKSYKTKDYLGRISRGNCSFLKLLNHFFKLLIYNVMLISDVKQSESDFFGLITRHVGY